MNLRTMTSVGAVLALVSVVVTANLWRELAAERELTASLREQLAGSTRITASAPAVREVAQPVVAAAAEEQGKPAAKPEPAPRARPAARDAIINEQELLKDPEYRKARAMMLRATMDQMNPGLAEELGLGKEETDKLMDLMSEQQLALSVQMQPFGPDTQRDPAAMQQTMRERQALQARQNEELRTLLGDARYAKYQEYLPTRSGRMQAQNYANNLAMAGSPLDSAQLKSVTTAVVAAQKNAQQEMQTLLRNIDRSNPAAAQAQLQEISRNRQANINRRVLEATAPHLSAQQQAVLRAQFEQEDAMNRAANRARERLNQAGATQPNGF